MNDDFDFDSDTPAKTEKKASKKVQESAKKNSETPAKTEKQASK